jgi:uncharacterized protein (TIGR03435 family)
MSVTEIAVRIVFLTIVSSVQNTRPAFEVASIRSSVDAPRQAVAAAGTTNGAQFRIAGLTIRDYISMAYAVKLNQISGPDWITTDRFDIAATLPEGSRTDQVPGMMQSLLEDRFELKTHREKKEFAVYALRVASSGLKMAEVAGAGIEQSDSKTPQTFTRQGSGRGISLDLGQGSSFDFANNRIEGKKLTMATLAGMVERFLDRPVVNLTGLNGSYDVAFDLAPEDYRAMLIRAATAAGLIMSPDSLRLLDSSPAPASLFEGLAKFGLHLEGSRAPLDVLVVDSIRKTPTEN